MIDGTPPRFQPGRVVITPGAQAAFRASGEGPTAYLGRHLRGDWGDLGDHDRRANEDALRTGARILSAYTLRSGVQVWVITEAVGDGGRRASTCLLLPDEY